MEISGYHSDKWLEPESFLTIESIEEINIHLFLPENGLAKGKFLYAIVNGNYISQFVSRGSVFTLKLPPSPHGLQKIALLAEYPEKTFGADQRLLGFLLVDVLRQETSIIDGIVSEVKSYSQIDVNQYIGHASLICQEFDRSFYRSQIPDGTSLSFPEIHYLLVGWKNGYDPSKSFSTSGYIELSRDVEAAGINPLYHFLTEGIREGRQAPASTRKVTIEDSLSADFGSQEYSEAIAAISDHFDPIFYRDQLGAAGENVTDPILHYLKEGWRVGLNPTHYFSTKYYLDCNPDVYESGINPFHHYITEGRKYDRLPSHPGGDLIDDLLKIKSLNDQVVEWSNWSRPKVKQIDRERVIEILAAETGGDFSNLIITICHDDYRKTPGGIQLCIQREQEVAQKSGYCYMAIFPAKPIPRLLAHNEYKDSMVDVVLSGELIGRVLAEDLVAALTRVRSGSAAKAVIIHQLMGQAPEFVARVAITSGAEKIFFWLHDYFSLCPSYALQRNGIKYCNAPSVNSNSCQLCLYGQERKSHVQRVEQLFQMFDIHVISPSEVAIQVWRNGFSTTPRLNSILPHLDISWSPIKEAPPLVIEAGPFHLAFTGTIASLKGWQTFERVARRLASSDRFRFSVLSMQKPSISKLHHEEVRVTTADKTVMIQRLQSLAVDCVIHWARWPETFSFSAYEAIASGAYIITNSGSGNVAAYVHKTGKGKVFENEGDLISFLESDEFLEMKEEIRNERSKFAATVTMSDMTFNFIKIATHSDLKPQ